MIRGVKSGAGLDGVTDEGRRRNPSATSSSPSLDCCASFFHCLRLQGLSPTSSLSAFQTRLDYIIFTSDFPLGQLPPPSPALDVEPKHTAQSRPEKRDGEGISNTNTEHLIPKTLMNSSPHCSLAEKKTSPDIQPKIRMDCKGYKQS